ncbi:MAG: DNA polymerase IV, partial [Clostridia bacterium]|nr:DNA polymerase IV [Clostridia bacterium]
DLAQMEEGVLRRIFGVNGTMLWMYANGQDHSRVMQNGETLPIKSVGHGITCNADLTSDEEVRRVILELCQNIGLRLCQAGMVAKGIQVDIKDHELCVFSWMDGMPTATRSRRVLAQQAFLLYRKRYQGQRRIRAVTVRAIRLEKAGESTQLDYFCDYVKTDKLERIEQVTDELTTRFGHTALCPADVLINDKTKTKEHYQATMPHGMRKL